MDYFKFLPVEITLDILARLLVESVIDCKSVCTNWKGLVRQPSFSKMYLQHLNHNSSADYGKLSFLSIDTGENYPFKLNQLYYFEYNENQENVSRIRRINLTLPFICHFIVGSLNGLICLYGRLSQDKEIYVPACICNPMTRECVILPESNSLLNSKCNIMFSGFGYLRSTNEYKVVRIICTRLSAGRGEATLEVEIYTVGSGNGWRNLGNLNYNLDISHCINGAFSNGALYWTDKEERIVVFDMAEEKFCGHIMPPSLQFRNRAVPRLGVWDGFLHYNVKHVKDDRSESEIWLLKEQEKYHSLSWSKEFTLVTEIPFGFTKSGCVLEDRDCHLYIYEPKSSTSKMLVDCGYDVCQILPHKNSLVTLRELGEEETQILESSKIEEVQSSDLQTN